MPREEIDERLPVLGDLLARGEIYRPVSAQVALTGGLLSLVVAGAMLAWQMGPNDRNVDARLFFELWALVCLATLTAAGFFLSRAARSRGEPLVSAGLKLALSALTPSLFAGAAIGACLTITSGLPIFPAALWVVFYGLGLLAWRDIAPAGMVVLGWAFLLTGIGIFLYLTDETMMPEFDLPTPANFYPAAIMGATFGCYHLIYAAWMWPRRQQVSGSRAALSRIS
jgi:hypothetical protein